MIYNSKPTIHEKLHIFYHLRYEEHITTKHETAMVVVSETLALNQP
jgi:hypothetical protein